MKVVLHVSRKGQLFRDFAFEKHDTFLVGRSADAHLSLPSDKYFSRNHFLLEVNPPLCRLRDLGSANGTFVNGVRTQTADLKHGDVITAGETRIEIQIDAPVRPASAGQAPAAGPSPGDPPATVVLEPDVTRLRTGPSPRSNRRASSLPSTRAAVPPRPSAPPVDPQRPTPAGPSNSTAPLMVGDYRIVKELARGGMGVAYLAERPDTGARVVIKTVIPQVQLEGLNRKMFMREIKTLSALRHPRIVHFVESGQCDGVDFYVMELVDGKNLHACLQAHPGGLPWQTARAIILQCLDALTYTHGLNIVHRDLHPGNIMVLPGNSPPEIRILDFGLAKNYEEAGSITLTGQGKGSLAFMPPEQVLNCKSVGPLSDLYSLTAVLYFMLSGKYTKDFPAKQDPIRVLLEGPIVPLAQRGVQVQTALLQLMDQGLAKDPYRRFKSAAEMAAAIKQIP